MWGYGIGAAGQGSCYKFMGSYFVSFLVNCVYLDAGKASLIASLALYIEAIAGVLIGNISDTFPSKMGRRRPFILTSAIILPVVLILITHRVVASEALTVMYYLILAIMFRVLFSNFEIPYMALGAEVAKDYDERTKLRTVTRYCGILGNIIGYVASPFILGLFRNNEEMGWQVTGIVVAFFVCVPLLLCVKMTEGKGVVIEKGSIERKSNIFSSIFKNYFELARLKPMRLLIVYKACFGSAMALFDVGMIFYLTCSLGLSNTNSALIYALQIVVFLLFTPVVKRMALSMGKAKQQLYALGAGGILGVIIFLVKPSHIVSGVLYMCIFAIVQTSFWQLSGSIFYDCVEVDEWVNGKRREGDIMSMVSVLGTLVTALMVQVFGILLEMSGYDASAAVQSDSAVLFLNVCYILLPSVLTIIAAVSVKLLPINKKTFESLQMGLERRRNGESYDEYMEDIKKICG